MQVIQNSWQDGSWESDLQHDENVSLVFIFGERSILEENAAIDEIRAIYPGAVLLGGSTSGEILGEEVLDNSIVYSAIRFDKTKLEIATTECKSGSDSFEAGQQLAKNLNHDELTHVFVISNGLHVNGTDLSKGLASALPPKVTTTGGLTGDGAQFSKTWVIAGDQSSSTLVAAIGLYGAHLRVGFGSAGGWEVFGPERAVTKSNGGVLFELDDKSALSLYKKYLGEHVDELPGSALLFPLMVKRPDSDRGVVRTILSIDEEEQSMTFAGDVPSGSTVHLMRSNTNRLVDGASDAATKSIDAMGTTSPEFAILVSCVGRKLVMKQRVEEEVEAVQEIIGEDTKLIGFYSYGELAPYEKGSPCELHNQTMTITTFAEV
ncbi:MAG: FIST N-terminal domain-containing protein [Myxococcota bacterium]|nr:FIST N-terminal domain-containing protein [Myxococcota bacterium]